MPDARAFLVPGAKAGKQEELYADFASVCDCPVPSREKRIYSITYDHDGITWTATVGETLTGISWETVRRQGQKLEQPLSHNNSAVVLAIFPGVSYKMVTDRSNPPLAHPALVGQPRSARYFSSETDSTHSKTP